MSSIAEVKTHLIGTGHGGTLNKVRNIEALFERAQNTMLSKIEPVETQRLAPITTAIHDDIYNYPLPSDYRKLIDIIPQSNRGHLDGVQRVYSAPFDLRKALANKTVSIESNNGTKFIRINWQSRKGKTLDAMNSDDDWSVVGSATGLAEDELYKVSGSAALRFDLAATGDGLQATALDALDLTDEDELADFFMWLYFPSVSALTSVTGIWGNDLATNYWTSVAQTTQANGEAFKAGWNLIKFPWATATETGTVAPASIDSFKFTIAATGAIADIRADNIIVSLGRLYDIKYYSQYIFKNSSGNFISQPTSDDDTVVLTGTAYQIFLMECVIAIAQQTEGEDSAFDITWAEKQLYGNAQEPGLYQNYRGEYPSESKKAVTSYGSLPRFRR